MATTKITVNKNVSLKVEADVGIIAREWYARGLQGTQVSLFRFGRSHTGHFKHEAQALEVPTLKGYY